jgi:uncharacterized protein (TIGR02246 family)
MAKMIISWFPYNILILVIACQSSDKIKVDISPEVEAIKKVIATDYINAVNANDTAAYVKLFAEDVFWAPPGSPIAKSKMEIKNSLQKNFDANELNLSPGTLEIDVKGDFAYVLSTDFTLIKKPREGDEEFKSHGSAIWLLQKQEDRWKIFRQVYNTRDY